MREQVSNKRSQLSQTGIGLFRAAANQHRARQAVAGLLALTMLPLSLGSALGQQGAPEPPDEEQQSFPVSNYRPLPPEQLDQLVAPIALYPDSLVAQVLAGATYPAQLASAQQFVEQSGNYPPEELAELANQQPWDPSVKSLVAFPQVLDDLNRNIDWTTQLGNAYFNQPQDVLAAVQAMRQRAYSAGNLRPSPQLNVEYEPSDIVIVPVSPAIVYVPYYDPWLVYGEPIPVYAHYHYYGPPRGISFGAGLAVGFGLGVAIGAFSHFGWGYHNWSPDWHNRTVVYQHNTYISRSVTVINHGNYGRYDRAPEARSFNQQQASRFGSPGYHTTINNVTVNRGGNTTNTYNRKANINPGGSVYNRGGATYNSAGGQYNRGAAPYRGTASPVNGTANPYNRGYDGAARSTYSGAASPQGNVYNRAQSQGPQRGAQQSQPQSYSRPQQNVPQSYQRPQAAPQSYNRPQTPPQNYNRPAPQPQQSARGGSERGQSSNHGGGGQDSHGDHRR